MSQISVESIYKDVPVHVVGGWDQGQYFLVVFDGDNPVWTDADYFSKNELQSIEPIQNAIQKLGISTPPGFWEKFQQKNTNACWAFVNNQWKREW